MIRTADKHTIAYTEDTVDPSNVVVMCHGITSSKEEGGFYTSLAASLNHAGLSTLRFDFRGHGDSPIPPTNATVAGMIADLNSVINYVSKRYGQTSIIAASFGASILLLLMQRRKVPAKGVVFLNPVTDYRTVFTARQTAWSRAIFPARGLKTVLSPYRRIRIGDDFVMSPLMALELYYYEPSSVCWSSGVPALVLHGTDDQIVPITDSRSFVRRSHTSYIEMAELPNATHGLDEALRQVMSMSCEFIRRCTR